MLKPKYRPLSLISVSEILTQCLNTASSLRKRAQRKGVNLPKLHFSKWLNVGVRIPSFFPSFLHSLPDFLLSLLSLFLSFLSACLSDFLLNSPHPRISSGELKISCDLGEVHLLWKLKTTGKSTFAIFFPSLTDANLLNALDGGAGPGKCRLRRLFRLSP